MTFDLDPGEGVGWREVQQGAQLVRTVLIELGLPRRRQNLCRLPSQRLWRHHRGRLVSPGAPWNGRLGAGGVGRTRFTHRQRALDGQHAGESPKHRKPTLERL